jgi:2-methylcitrate dehydratase PrpD
VQAPRDAAVRSLRDWCACVRAGADAAQQWPLELPARLAVAAHLRDQDDLHYGTVSHPGGIVWSAVAACAIERDVSFSEAATAAAFGYELMVRLADAAGPEHRERWHVTATAGTVGAAGAAARLIGCDEADAVAHACSVAGGAVHAMVERTTTRFLHRGHAVVSGLACARAGKPGGRRILDDGRGTFVLASPERVTAPRPVTALEETGFRLRPATGFAHAPLDAVQSLGPLGEVDHVNVSVSLIAATLASNTAPQNEDEAWWSIEHAVASALEIDIGRVEVRATTEGWAAAVEVRLRDGSVRNASVSEPLGHPDRPVTDDDLRAKWARLGGAPAPGDDGDSFGDLVRQTFPIASPA